MARFDFSNLDQDFNFQSQFATYSTGTAFARTANHFAWMTSLSRIDFTNVGSPTVFTYSGNVPALGTVTGFTLDLDNDGDTVMPELVVTNLSFALNKLAPLETSSPALSVEAQNDLIWQTVLSGDDTIEFGANAGNFRISFFGDGRNASGTTSILGGKDIFTGNVGPSGFASGDFFALLSGTKVFGGADTLDIKGDKTTFVIGDAAYVPGFLVGGNDKISVKAGGVVALLTGDVYQVYGGGTVTGGNDEIKAEGAMFTIGDAQFVSGIVNQGKPYDSNVIGGTLVGGDDIITGTSESGPIIGGDVYQILDGGIVRGGADIINGGTGSEFIFGDAFQVDVGGTLYGGNDIIHGGDGGDTIFGDWYIDESGTAVGGDDKLYGDLGSDEIHGDGGNDEIHGGAEFDLMYGDAGDDVFVIDQLSDIADGDYFDGGSGTDKLRVADLAGSYVIDVGTLTINSLEAITYGAAGTDGTATFKINTSQLGTGLSLNATITGNSLAGVSDTFAVVMDGNASLDLSGLKMVNFSNPGDKVTITGDGSNNTIIGTGVNDTIDGGKGADTMTGGLGNDIYRIDNVGDVVIEGKNGGTADVILSKVNYTLGKGVYVEFLQTNSTLGTASIDLVGNELSQTIIGNAGVNKLSDGRGAGDVLKGLGGNDIYRIATAATTIIEGKDQGSADVVLAAVSYVLNKGAYIEYLQTNSTLGTSSIDLTGNELAQTLIGNAGANRLDGKGGADTLTGLGGADTFVFSSALNLGVDTISDFNAVDDTIELSKAIFAALNVGALGIDAFTTNTTGAATDSLDRIIYQTTTGKLFYDADGTGSGAPAIHFATLTGQPAITNLDFVVV